MPCGRRITILLQALQGDGLLADVPQRLLPEDIIGLAGKRVRFDVRLSGKTPSAGEYDGVGRPPFVSGFGSSHWMEDCYAADPRAWRFAGCDQITLISAG